MNTPHEASARTPENTQDDPPKTTEITEKEVARFVKRYKRECQQTVRRQEEWMNVDYTGF